MSDATRYEVANMRAVFAVVEALSLKPLVGMTAAAVGEASGAGKDRAYKVLRNGELEGWIEPAPGGGWRLTPKASWIAERHRVALADEARLWLGGPQ